MELFLARIILVLGSLELIQGNLENAYGEYEYSEEAHTNISNSQQSESSVTRQGTQKRWTSDQTKLNSVQPTRDYSKLPIRFFEKYYARFSKPRANRPNVENRHRYFQNRVDDFYNKLNQRKQRQYDELHSEIDATFGDSPSQETGTNDSGHHKKKNCTKKLLADEDLFPENRALLVGAEPMDGPKAQSEYSPADLIKKSYQPYYICGSNNPDGMQSCRSICDIRDRQRISCLGKFCYCQTSYGPQSPLEYQPSEKSPFFFCGKYNLEGFEKCIDQCKSRNKGSVQCGGSSCYCHYTVYKLPPLISNPETDIDMEANNPEERIEESEQRSKSKVETVKSIHASYCGRAPTRVNMAGSDKSFPNVIDNINMCRYRCKGGKFRCGKLYCYCVGSGLTILD